jgi:hypothetical protein
MRRIGYLVILVLALLLLVACQSSGAPEQAERTPISQATRVPTETPTEPPARVQAEPNYCLECHLDQERLIETVAATAGTVAWQSAIVVPMEPWEKVLISASFIETVHGHIACTDCHSGVQSPDKALAHEELVARPSTGDSIVCSDCHPNVTDIFADSLHATLRGFKSALETRSTPENHPILGEAFNEQCAVCHTTCGDCHVSQPGQVGGGFLDGHHFLRTPPMTGTCTVCHGSRVGNEFLGLGQGLLADIHYRGGMTCTDCHSGVQLHGEPDNCLACHPGPESAMIPPPDHRYSGAQSPSCEACHMNISLGIDNNPMHVAHGADLSCQVCHALPYPNYAEVYGLDATPFYDSEAAYYTFLIGLNPERTFERPYKYVPVRQVSITPDLFAAYGENLLNNFNALPTWVYATPHNIQRTTIQAASCNTCHGNETLFLTEDKLRPEDLEANQGVIVPQIPPPLNAAGETP